MADHLTPEARRAAKSFLRLMRDPQKQILRVDESCELNSEEFTRTVQLELAPTTKPVRRKPDSSSALSSAGPKGSSYYFELLSPKKGFLPDLTLLDHNVPVRRLDHDSHWLVAGEAILFRFQSLVRASVVLDLQTNKIDKTATKRLDRKLAPVLEELTKLPTLSPEEAQQLVEKHFHASGVLRSMLNFPACRIDAKRALGLHRLCELLAERYLALVQVEVPPGFTDPVTIKYQYRQRVGNADSGQPRWIDQPVRRFRQELRAVFGLPPTRVRIHLPLAKKTNHFSFHMAAPDSYFLARQRVLQEELNAASGTRRLVGGEMPWAINFGRGSRSHIYIDRARKHVSGRVYAGFILEELPAHSSFRAALSISIACALALIFSLSGSATDSTVLASSALVVALFGAGALAAEAVVPHGNFLGAPILARLTIFAASAISAMLAVWLVMVADPPALNAWPSKFISKPDLREAGAAWLQHGALWLAGAAGVFLLLSYIRCIKIAWKYRILTQGQDWEHQMYLN